MCKVMWFNVLRVDCVLLFTRGYCEQVPDGNDEVHPDIEDGFQEVGIDDELTGFSECLASCLWFLVQARFVQSW